MFLRRCLKDLGFLPLRKSIQICFVHSARSREDKHNWYKHKMLFLASLGTFRLHGSLFSSSGIIRNKKTIITLMQSDYSMSNYLHHKVYINRVSSCSGHLTKAATHDRRNVFCGVSVVTLQKKQKQNKIKEFIPFLMLSNPTTSKTSRNLPPCHSTRCVSSSPVWLESDARSSRQELINSNVVLTG